MSGFAELGTESARLWRGKDEVPSPTVLRLWLEALQICASSSREEHKNARVGDLATAYTHVASFVSEAHEDLLSKFCGGEKFFLVDVLRSDDTSEVDILFQLKTEGVDGSTLFRTAVKRVGQDRYLYLE